MSGSKIFDEDQPGEMGNNSPRRTIVGGRPPERETKLPPVPVGLQSLLRLASVDREFCEELIRNREKAAHAAGIELTSSETAMLCSITDDQIRNMARGLPEPAMDRRSFLQQAARSAVLILGGAALARCTKDEKGETLPARKDHNDVVRGIGPDIPPDIDEQDPRHDEIEPEEKPEEKQEKEQTESEQEEGSEKPGKKDSVQPNLNIKRTDEHDRTRGIRSDRPPPRTSRRSTTKPDPNCESRAVTRGMGAAGGIAPDIPLNIKPNPEK